MVISNTFPLNPDANTTTICLVNTSPTIVSITQIIIKYIIKRIVNKFARSLFSSWHILEYIGINEVSKACPSVSNTTVGILLAII